MKNPPNLLSQQFRPVAAAKGIMKNIIPGKLPSKYQLFHIQYMGIRFLAIWAEIFFGNSRDYYLSIRDEKL